MKSTVIVMSGLCILISAFSVQSQNLLNQPESVVYDVARDRYLASNWANGRIVAIDSDGNQSYFNTDLANVAGLHIVDNTLYAASNNGPLAGLIGFDLETGEMVVNVVIPGQDILNGITSDNSGYLYVTDWDDGGAGGNKIYRVDVSEQSYTEIVSYINMPNGIEFDEANNRLLVVCNYGSNDRIFAVSLDDYSTQIVAYLGVDGDGLTRDNEGNYYFSSWAYDAVYRRGPDLGPPTVLVASAGLNNPADINFNRHDNILAVPNFGGNSVSLITFSDTDEDGVIDLNDNCMDTPNPDQNDADGDGFGDLCDICNGHDDAVDDDEDGVPDGCDTCPGYDDSVDNDEDGVADDCDNCPEHYNPAQEDSNGNDVGDICDYTCGDSDGDRIINILDIVYLINNLYKSGPAPDPVESADVNYDLSVNILDIVYLINFIYKNGPEPVCY